MARTVVHTAYEWGRLTEAWIGDQAMPVGSFSVQIVSARGESDPARNLRTVANDRPTVVGLIDRVCARLTARRWAPAYVALVDERSSAVLHAHFGDWGYAMAPVARRLGVPLVVSFYGYDASRLPRAPTWRRRLAELFREATVVLAEGPAMAQRLRDIGCAPHRIRIVPLAVDLRDWPMPTRDAGQRSPDVRPHLVIASSLREKKGVDTALRAVASARESLGTRWRLTIVGDGPLRRALGAEAKRLGIDRNVIWLGYRPLSELREVLASADLLIQASQTAADGDTEGGAPVILLQAAAAGVPVLGTRHADIGWIVEDDVTGWLAAERDVAALARKLEKAVAQGLLPKAGRRARRRAEERFDLPLLHAALASVYAEVAP